MAGRKANFQWFSAPAVAGTVWATTAASTISFQTLITFTDPGTIRRIIVDFFATTGNTNDNIAPAGRVGIILANPREVAVGATAVPAPITDGEVEWLWNRAYALEQQLIGTDAHHMLPQHLHDDVRGMRKFKESQSLICVIENGAGALITTMASIRVLTST